MVKRYQFVVPSMNPDLLFLALVQHYLNLCFAHHGQKIQQLETFVICIGPFTDMTDACLDRLEWRLCN